MPYAIVTTRLRVARESTDSSAANTLLVFKTHLSSFALDRCQFPTVTNYLTA
jgi:hypothetical protein